MPGRTWDENEISLQQPIAQYRFQCGDIVFGDLFLGDMVTAKGSHQVACHVGPCGLYARSDGDHNGEVFGADGSPASTVCTRYDSGDGSRFCALRLV